MPADGLGVSSAIVNEPDYSSRKPEVGDPVMGANPELVAMEAGRQRLLAQPLQRDRCGVKRVTSQPKRLIMSKSNEIVQPIPNE